MKRVTTKEAAKILGLCVQRIDAKLKQGHFPGSSWCECGRSRMIPESKLNKSFKDDIE